MRNILFNRLAIGCQLIILWTGLTLASQAYAQRVVSFSPEEAIFSTQQAQQLSQQLSQELQPQIGRLQNLDAELQKLQQRAQQDAALLSEEEAEQLQKTIRTQAAEAQKLQQYIANIKTQEEQAFTQQMLPLLDKVLEDYIKANDITMVLNNNAVVYVAATDNITPAIIDLLNQQVTAQ